MKIILPRNHWSGLGLAAAMTLALAAVAWAGYTGPNRTTTQQVRDPANDQWFCDKSGRPRCWFPPGNPCPDAGGSHPSVEAQRGCFGGLPADSCGCDAHYTQQTVNLPPATVGGSAVCGVPGSSGWCRGGATLNLSANEPLGGEVIEIVEGNPAGLLCDPANAPSISCSWAGSDGNFTLQFWAVSSFGDTSSMSSADWKVDAGPPSITLSVSGGTQGSGGWVRGGTINLSASGADSLSGVASADVSVDGGAWRSSGQVGSDGIHQVSGRVRDAAGNEATTAASIRYDSTPPNLSPDLSGKLGRDGWYISPVTASASASDSLSGVAERQVSAGGGWQASPLVLAQDGTYSLRFRAVDVAGNEAVAAGPTVKVDAGPPSITLSVTGGTQGGGGWYRGGTINLSASGADSVSGVASADVSVDGGAWRSSGQVGSDGIHQVSGRVRDAAGNEATTSASIRYDSTPPNVSPDISGTLGREGWYTSPVTASASASDSLSGVAERQVSAGGGWQASPLVLAQDGTYSLSYRAVDVAGNENTAAGPTLKIDAHPPTSVFIVPPNGSQTWVSGIVDLLGQSLDFGSGLFAVEISFDQGAIWRPLQLRETDWSDQWDTRQVPNGTYIVLARARDVAGHLESTAKVSLRVDNLPPLVDIPDSWLVGELAPLTVEEKDIGLAGARVLIQSGEAVLVKLEYEPDQVPDHITWDGVMPDGSQAAPGEYGVYATAWDLAGNLGRDSGVIVVPGLVDLPPGETSARSEFVDEIQPKSESTIDVPASQPLLIARGPWLWPAIAWFGLLGGLAAAKLSDPRPHALRGLRQELMRIRMSMED